MALSNVNTRAVILDVYGTLLQVGPPAQDADLLWQRLFRDRLRIEPRLSRLEFAVASSRAIARRHQAARARGIPWPEVQWPSVAAEVVPELAQLSESDQAEFAFRQIQTGHTTRMAPEAASGLRWLRERWVLLGIASNAQGYTLRELEEGLAAYGLGLGLFEPDLCFWSFAHGFSKPDPHAFQILTARLEARGVAPGEILMVGDHLENDIQPAQAHGWRTWQLGLSASDGWGALLENLGGSTVPLGEKRSQKPA